MASIDGRGCSVGAILGHGFALAREPVALPVDHQALDRAQRRRRARSQGPLQVLEVPVLGFGGVGVLEDLELQRHSMRGPQSP
jgi:hypothetical protein